MRCNAMQQDNHSLQLDVGNSISQSTTPYPGGGRNWYPDELQSLSLPVPVSRKVPESSERRQMDIAPPCPSRLPRSGLAHSDPWLPNGLHRCPCLLHPCLQRIELQPPSRGRGETDLVCGMCIPMRYCTVAALYRCCIPHQRWAILGCCTRYCGAVDQTTRQEQPLSVWFCFPSSPSPPPSGRRETSRDCLYSRFSLLPSPVSSLPVVTPRLSSPLSCPSRPCVARHETFLRVSVGVLTVPGFPFSSASSSTALFLFSRPAPTTDCWPFQATHGQSSPPNPTALSLSRSSTAILFPHSPSLSPPRLLVTPVPRPGASHRIDNSNRYPPSRPATSTIRRSTTYLVSNLIEAVIVQPHVHA